MESVGEAVHFVPCHAHHSLTRCPTSSARVLSMIPARCASTIFVDNPSDAAVKRLLAEWADADFFEPHDIIRTVILQADIYRTRMTMAQNGLS